MDVASASIDSRTAFPLGARPTRAAGFVGSTSASSKIALRSTSSVRNTIVWSSSLGFAPETTSEPSGCGVIVAPCDDVAETIVGVTQASNSSFRNCASNVVRASRSLSSGVSRVARNAAVFASRSATNIALEGDGMSSEGSSARFASGTCE